MRKVFPHIDLGTGYVQLSRLPFDQSIKLREWLPHTSLVKVKAEEGTLEDCVQYSEYEYWFDFLYHQEEAEFEF